MMNNIKTCSKCKQEFPATTEFFYIVYGRINQLQSSCKECRKKESLKWQRNNRLKRRLIRKKSYAKNRDNYVDRKSEYAKNNREKINKRRQARRNANPSAKLNKTMRNGIYFSLNGKKNCCPWKSMVDYTLDDLKKHIEKGFQPGMSWDNYGKWHLDHIIPISVFNFTTPEHDDFKRCWSLKNLQPLWAKDNLSKNNKLEKHFQPRLAL